MKRPFNEVPAHHIIPKAPAALYATDENGLLTYYNDEIAQLWGYYPCVKDPAEQVFGAWRFYHGDGSVLPYEDCPMVQVLRNGKSFRAKEIAVKKPDGVRLVMLVNADPILSEKGLLTGSINILQDITCNKGLDENIWRLAAVVESSNDAIMSKTLEGVIVSWNKAAERMLGYTAREIIGQNIERLIPPSRRDEEKIIIDKIKHNERVDWFETTRQTKDGKNIPVSLTVSPVKNALGKVIGASTIARDISVQAEAQNRLKFYNRKLKQLNDFKDGFIGLASHELRTPLAVIKANLQFVEKHIPESEWTAFIHKALVQTDKLADILSNLLDISKIQAGKFSLQLSQFSFKKLLDECIDNMLLLKHTHAIERHYDLEGVTVFADRIRIEQVIINLLSNAIKYSPGKDRVIVRSYLEGEKLVVCVDDFGLGISSEETDKVFNMFFRAEEMRLYPGLGVGLYLSRQIIKGHRGQIWVKSKPGEGSSFCFRIPLQASEKRK